MGKLNNFWSYLQRHKYLITAIIGILIIGVLDENSFRKYAQNQLRINELNEEIATLEQQYLTDSVKLKNLEDDPKGIERVARERYLMKRPNEDIFLIREE